MKSQEIRRVQQANSFQRALDRLNAAVKLSEKPELSDLEAQGLNTRKKQDFQFAG